MNESLNPERETFQAPVLLRRSREGAGLHIAALAAALKVPVRKLEALEAGRYHELPDLTFARALASSACRHLKIDPAPILEQIPSRLEPQLGDPNVGINAPFKAPEEGNGQPIAAWLFRPAVLASLALLVAALVIWFVPGLGSGWLEKAGAAWDSISAPTASDTASQQPTGTDSGSSVLPPVGASGSQNQNIADPVAATSPVVLTPSLNVGESGAPIATSNSLLSITATADSWVEVVDGAGKTQVQRMLKSGDVLDFSATPPYSVVVGRADAVAVQVRGQVFDVTPYARNSVARFQVK